MTQGPYSNSVSARSDEHRRPQHPDNHIKIDLVGEFRGKRFECFRCSSAREVISVLYPCEQNQYLSKRRQSLHADKIYNERSFVHVDTEDSEAIISGLLKGAAEFYGASKECTNYFKCNFHPLHQATASLNCFHVISLQKRRSGTYRDFRKRDC